MAAVATYLIAYRYYSLYIARNVMRLDPARPTPAVRLNDGLDYVPTDRNVLFGHHFAAIAGAGRASIVKENGVERLKIEPLAGKAVRIEDGREGHDALGALGLGAIALIRRRKA